MTCVIDISLLQFGQLSIVGTTEHARLVLMTLPFARQNVGASKRLTLDWMPVSLKKQELELARSLCDSGSITKIIVRLLSTTVEQKRNRVTTLAGCIAAQRLPSDNHFVICGPKLALILLTGKWADEMRQPDPDRLSSWLSPAFHVPPLPQKRSGLLAEFLS